MIERTQDNEIRLTIGQRIKHTRTYRNSKTKERILLTQKGTVESLYSNIFRVRWDDHDYLECFPKAILECTPREAREWIRPI